MSDRHDALLRTIGERNKQIRELEAERDRLRAVVDELEAKYKRAIDEDAADRLTAHENLTAVDTERDRLRAVVDTARRAVAECREAVDAAIAEDTATGITLRLVSTALSQIQDRLDASPTGEDT